MLPAEPSCCNIGWNAAFILVCVDGWWVNQLEWKACIVFLCCMSQAQIFSFSCFAWRRLKPLAQATSACLTSFVCMEWWGVALRNTVQNYQNSKRKGQEGILLPVDIRSICKRWYLACPAWAVKSSKTLVPTGRKYSWRKSNGLHCTLLPCWRQEGGQELLASSRRMPLPFPSEALYLQAGAHGVILPPWKRMLMYGKMELYQRQS